MILDSFENFHRYEKYGAGFHDAVRFIAEKGIESLPEGRTDVSENLFILNQTYETGPAAEGKYESHHRYIDVQYLIEGEEAIYWQDIRKLEPIEANPERDYVFYHGEGCLTELKAGNFMIFFPSDGHMPSKTLHSPRTNHKIVFKILCPDELK